jgi:long-chain acyl-CoA synthetase
MNLAKNLENAARNNPDRTAIRHEGEHITFGELNRACNRLANGLTAAGLGPGDRCLAMLPNSIHQITLYYALAKMGAVAVPVNFLYRSFELGRIMDDARPQGFVGAEPYLAEPRKVLGRIDNAPPVRFALDAGDDRQFKDLREAYADNSEFALHPTRDEATFKILYTSGTTGAPKGVMLSHWNLGRNAEVLANMRGSIHPETVVIGALPLYHVYGITSVINVSIYLGITIELFTHFDPERIVRVIEGETRTLFFGVPTMLNRLIQAASGNPPVRSSLQFCISGGASLPVEFIQRFESVFQTEIHEGYGLTECPVCVENPYDRETKPGSIGLPIPEFDAMVVDEEHRPLPAGSVGELLIKGPAVMQGYWNRPEESAEALRGGWLHTGDLARMDEDGFIYIVDRKKELVIRGGFNVYPREVEEVLYQIPGVSEAAVYGVPHQDLGEEVAAVVFLDKGARLEEEDIRRYVKERVAPYKYPRIVHIADAPLPKSGSGKILKKEVKKKYLL